MIARLGWVLAACVAVCGSAPVDAQARRAAIVVRGDAVDTAQVGAELRTALGALGYEVLADDAVAAAIAFGAADDDALRAALAVEMLAVVETRRAEGREVFVSVVRVTESGRQQELSRVARGEVGAFAATQLGDWIRAAPSVAVVPVPSEPSAVVTVAPIGPAPAAEYPQPMSQPLPPVRDPDAPAPGAAIGAPGLLFLALGIVGYILTPILSPLVLCSSTWDAPCEIYAAYGVIPFAGPWLVLENPMPGHPWDEGEQAALAAFGIAQAVFLPLGIVLIAIAASMGPADAAPQATLELAPTLGGGELRLRGRF